MIEDFEDDEINDEPYPPTEAVGTLKTTQTKIIWTIDDFQNVVGEYGPSEIPKNSVIHPVYYISDFEKDGEEYIVFEGPGRIIKNKIVKISFLMTTGEERFECTLTNDCGWFNTDKHFKKSDVVRELDDKNTLRVVISITSGLSIATKIWKGVRKGVKRRRLMSRLEELDSFRKMFNDKKFGDVIFRVEGKNIYTQKSVLICKSPVFAAMFSGDTLENKTNFVDIVDNTYDSMYAMLETLYVGVTEEHYRLDCKTSLGVLIAAEKYNLESLKESFQEIIVDSLNNDNALECLVVADSNNAAFLRQKALAYVALNAQDIVKMPSFKEFLKSHVDLSCEVINAVVASKKS